jgi:Type I phosphodiesterase / nucleotide pyrophosphatase
VHRVIACAIALAIGVAAMVPRADAAFRALETSNVILVVTDGLRWQEVFGGADSLMMFGEARRLGGDTAGTRREFWRATPGERRETLLPFMWGTLAKGGQLFGNVTAGSKVLVTNGLNFSYPGYNEMLAGFADPRIDRNDFGVNPNQTVFEWLNRDPAFQRRVAAFATWDVFADIFARDRSGVFVRAGWEPPYQPPRTVQDSLLNRMYAVTHREWGNNAWDGFMHEVAIRHVKAQRPRVLFLGYGETDEWAHAGRYDRYLHAARRVDSFLAELWSFVQSHPDYRDRTTLIVTTDHGRGRTVQDWSNHGRDVAGADEMWLAVIGPDTRARGERSNAAPIIQSQVAATVAALLGFDYRGEVRRAAPAIADVMP